MPCEHPKPWKVTALQEVVVSSGSAGTTINTPAKPAFVFSCVKCGATLERLWIVEKVPSFDDALRHAGLTDYIPS